MYFIYNVRKLQIRALKRKNYVSYLVKVFLFSYFIYNGILKLSKTIFELARKWLSYSQFILHRFEILGNGAMVSTLFFGSLVLMATR